MDFWFFLMFLVLWIGGTWTAVFGWSVWWGFSCYFRWLTASTVQLVVSDYLY